jgi:hypothetical protein
MKKNTASLFIFLIGFLGLGNLVKGQPNAVIVPTFQNQSELPPKMRQEQKLIKRLPLVTINENGADIALFKAEMNDWKIENPNLIHQFDKSISDLINNLQFDLLAEELINLGHTKELALADYKGGKHE